MKNDKSPIRLREKTLANGAKSLYLDIYKDGKRKYEYLKMYLNPGNDPVTKELNKTTLEAARVIMARKLVALQCGEAHMVMSDKKDMNFVEGYKEYFATKKASDKTVALSGIAISYWEDCFGNTLKLSQVNEDRLSEYLAYLRKVTPKSNNRIRHTEKQEMSSIEFKEAVRKMCSAGIPTGEIAKKLGVSSAAVVVTWKRINKHRRKDTMALSEGTIKRYFAFINIFLNYAEKQGLIHNPVKKLDSSLIPKDHPEEREYLTVDELKKMIDTPCALYDSIKNAFLFSCFTGLRFSDVSALTWGEIRNSEIVRKIKKTDKYIRIPLSENALRWMPKRNGADKDARLFPDWPSYETILRTLQIWADTAGIDKKITFHVSRHTFATMTLTYGADLYTVSSLLGHASVETTKIYAKIVDEKRKDAVNLIPKI